MEKYKLEEYLGRGSFGSVKRAIHYPSKSNRAIKLIENPDRNIVSQEVAVLKLVDHDYIIKYYESFFHSSGEFCIVLEYADAGTMSELISKGHFDNKMEYCVWRTISHISNALDYIHSLKPNHVLHRDLKPDNVLGVYVWSTKAQRNHIRFKLSDFGIAKLLTFNAQKQHYTSTVAGTPIYMAPEVLDKFQSYSFPADIWSFGCLISFYCNAQHLFTSEHSINNWGVRSPLNGFSQDLNDLLTQMLHSNPKSRPTAAYIVSETHKDNRQRHDIP